ncbi:MAG: RNA 2',3'-cyclic phosphodiesterase [Gallionella sp.]|nr:RNA 2',3'-cyclic phosphodiesterase [Gallionella sp.]
MNQADPHARVFFALWPGPAQREALAGWQHMLHPVFGGREMRADTLHATLVFLGNVTVRRLEALQLAARELTIAPFSVTFDQPRYWQHNHIAYAAPAAVPPALRALVAELQAGLRRHRFRFEQRDYQPHVTLLRYAQCSEAPLPQVPKIEWPVSDFVLVQSMPDAGTPHYQVLARFPLK